MATAVMEAGFFVVWAVPAGFGAIAKAVVVFGETAGLTRGLGMSLTWPERTVYVLEKRLSSTVLWLPARPHSKRQ